VVITALLQRVIQMLKFESKRPYMYFIGFPKRTQHTLCEYMQNAVCVLNKKERSSTVQQIIQTRRSCLLLIPLMLRKCPRCFSLFITPQPQPERTTRTLITTRKRRTNPLRTITSRRQ
jgi:hypothetical protein